MTTICYQEWLHARDLGLKDKDVDYWENCIIKLKYIHVRLKHEEYSLVWCLNPLGSYTHKDGYKVLSTQGDMAAQMWRWKKVWRFKCPYKYHTFIWLLLNKKC
jgi:hypothetical protein